MADNAEQYQELMKLYSTYGDEELLAMGRDMSELTEMAEAALKGEIARRGLQVAEPVPRAAVRVLDDDELERLRAYAALAPPECVFEFANDQGALAGYKALAEEGIESVVLAVDGSRIDQRGPRVVVSPEDAARAEKLLSQPLAERFRREVDEETPAEFELPVCSQCGGAETVLEEVDPVNHWRCEECGHSWVEEDVEQPLQ